MDQPHDPWALRLDALFGKRLGANEKAVMLSLCEAKGLMTYWDLAKLDVGAFDDLWAAANLDTGKAQLQLGLAEEMATICQTVRLDITKLKGTLRQMRACVSGVCKAQLMPASQDVAQLKAEIHEFQLCLDASELPESVGKLLYKKQAALDMDDYVTAEKLKKEIKDAKQGGIGAQSEFDKRVNAVRVAHDASLSKISLQAMEEACRALEFTVAEVVLLASSPVDDLEGNDVLEPANRILQQRGYPKGPAGDAWDAFNVRLQQGGEKWMTAWKGKVQGAVQLYQGKRTDLVALKGGPMCDKERAHLKSPEFFALCTNFGEFPMRVRIIELETIQEMESWLQKQNQLAQSLEELTRLKSAIAQRRKLDIERSGALPEGFTACIRIDTDVMRPCYRVERRVVAGDVDRMAYTYEEFVDFYGGVEAQTQWGEAEGAPVEDQWEFPGEKTDDIRAGEEFDETLNDILHITDPRVQLQQLKLHTSRLPNPGSMLTLCGQDEVKKKLDGVMSYRVFDAVGDVISTRACKWHHNDIILGSDYFFKEIGGRGNVSIPFRNLETFERVNEGTHELTFISTQGDDSETLHLIFKNGWLYDVKQPL